VLKRISKWLKDDDAVAAIEAAVLFPLMASLFFGTIDIGAGLTLNQKVLNATQMVADLLARNQVVDDAALSNSVAGGQLALLPYNMNDMGYDVAGIQFVNATLTPTVKWRATCKMTANSNVVTGATGLGAQNEGVIAVTIKYIYVPYFSGFMTGNIDMQEVSYARGRKGGYVSRTGSNVPCW
jgi:Flp pilus assembly protein TadG